MIEKGVIIKKIFDPYFEAPLAIWESFAKFLKYNSYKKNEKLVIYINSYNFIISDTTVGKKSK